MKYKALFFDRDGTLTYYNPEKEKYRDERISTWSGRPLALPYEKMMRLFSLASEGRSPWYKSLDDERAFFRRYYRWMLSEEGVTDDLENRAEADGAREQGFTSFLIDRSDGEINTAVASDRWTIRNLTQLVEFVQNREQ